MGRDALLGGSVRLRIAPGPKGHAKTQRISAAEKPHLFSGVVLLRIPWISQLADAGLPPMGVVSGIVMPFQFGTN